ncbi:ferroxidase [Saccharomycopsis crataegensis]|uniref:Ferroxidase n=1 Tax=Saccharomycopsis crataegensis TaxID=43959 RepID=A0AAV5QP72_9ASCO|nr:ferroxidase [Saccharomycopsis crataegensis]
MISYRFQFLITLVGLFNLVFSAGDASLVNSTFNSTIGSVEYYDLTNISYTSGETKTFYFDVTYFYASPDGFNRTVVGLNNTWPCPDIHVNRGDRVLIYVTNKLPDQNTSLHVHGLFQHGSAQFDGPEMINQCPIPPNETMLYNFTVPDQAGAFWYHSHTKGQYGDGFRGAFIIHDDTDTEVWDYDEEVVLTISEWYHTLSGVLDKSFLNVNNPTGAEPIPDNLLFNDTFNSTWQVQPNTTYLVRIINIGAFVSQYLYMEDHVFTVVEVDGVRVEPNVTDVLYITVAQRYTVLITTKSDDSQNYAFVQGVDEGMLDVPGTFSHNVTNQIVYNADAARAGDYIIESDDYDILDDFYLQPLNKEILYDDYDYQIEVNVTMNNLGNGVNYAFFNNITFTPPKVPILNTVLSAGENATNPIVYGTNTNSFVLKKDEIVQIVLNNQDTGTHPFHLHGHTFQAVIRGPDYSDEADPIPYDSSNFTSDVNDYPMMRDTFYVRPQSYFVVRFKANNPGVWFFHCHIEWHLSQGLAIVLIEDPEGIQSDSRQQLSDDYKRVCEKQGISLTGNAANNSVDYFDLTGENVQVAPLPDGFTARGIVAMVFSCLAGVLGIGAIALYGLSDIKNIEAKVAQDLDLNIEEVEEADENSSVTEIESSGPNSKK